MYIGVGIFLLVVGAILKYAVKAHVSGVSIASIGNIMMIGGVMAILISLCLMAFKSRRRGYHETRTQGVDPATGMAVETRDYDAQ